MKILLANKFFYRKGGAETVFFQERKFLIDQGHTVIDFSMEDERNLDSPFSDFFVPNISYDTGRGAAKKIRQGSSFIHSAVAVRHLEALLAREKPRIAHLHNIYHQLTPSIIPILKKHGVKVVLTLHDCKLVCPSYLALRNAIICNACAGKKFWNVFLKNCQNSRTRSLLLAAEALFHAWKGSYDGVGLFVAPSVFLADLTSKRIAPEKIRVLRNGIDPDQYQPNFTDQGYAVYFGRLSREKGIETLLRAHKGAGCQPPLKVIGTGPLASRLAGEYPGVDFLGYRSGQELHNLVADAAFVVVPSEWYENCSMVVLEAMALGKPVIGSRIGGIPEQVEDGRTGFLYEMGNTDELAERMAFLASQAGLRREMGQRARKKLEREYSLSNHFEGLLKIYNRLLKC